MRWKSHVRCGLREKLEIISKVYLLTYNHIEDENKKKPLSERWKIIGNNKIQRDLYSAYIIKNVNIEDRKTINREKMIEEFENFNKLHKKEIERLENLKKRKHKLISSFGI